MSDLIAYDSSRPSLIPADPAAVFPYCDGHYRWSRIEFPRALYRYITVLGDPGADIADFEPGCIDSPASLRAWAERRLGRGHKDLTVYCDRDNFPIVAGAMTGLDWHLFLSTLDGTKLTSFGGKAVTACQYTDRRGAYDMSEVYDRGWLNKP